MEENTAPTGMFKNHQKLWNKPINLNWSSGFSSISMTSTWAPLKKGTILTGKAIVFQSISADMLP